MTLPVHPVTFDSIAEAKAAQRAERIAADLDPETGRPTVGGEPCSLAGESPALLTDPTAKRCPTCGGICAIECVQCFRCELSRSR